MYQLFARESPYIARTPPIHDDGEKKGSIGYYIEVYRLPCEDHGGRYELTPDIYLGLYDDVDDLLDHCVIDGKTLREIIPSEDTRICSID